MQFPRNPAALAAVLALGACCKIPTNAVLGVPVTGQQESNWCWAASGQMTMNYIHPASNVIQCTEANQNFGQTSCCQTPGSTQCNNKNGSWPNYGLYNFNADMTDYTGTANATSFLAIQSQIACAGKPFAFSWHWAGGGGHMMVVVGYSTVDGVNYVTFNNPLPVNTGKQYIYTYDTWVQNPGQYTHWRDYTNITYTGS